MCRLRLRLRLVLGTHIKLIELHLKSPAWMRCPDSAVVDTWTITSCRRIQVGCITDIFWIVGRGYIVIVSSLCDLSLESLVTIHH